jgi:hypothetical protein
MAMLRGMDICTFLTLALDEGKWSPGCFTSSERVHSTHWVAPRAGLHTVKSRVIPELNLLSTMPYEDGCRDRGVTPSFLTLALDGSKQ